METLAILNQEWWTEVEKEEGNGGRRGQSLFEEDRPGLASQQYQIL